MPSSFVDSFPPIVKAMIDILPRRVIDIGPGWGKYGLACREYVDKVEMIHAIEVPQGRMPTQDRIYDHVHISDVRTHTSPVFWRTYDLALLIDVIEHMSLADGHKLLHLIQGSGCRVLVSTPKEFEQQHDEHNPYEEHISLWNWEEFAPHGIELDVSTIDSIIYVLPPRGSE